MSLNIRASTVLQMLLFQFLISSVESPFPLRQRRDLMISRNRSAMK